MSAANWADLLLHWPECGKSLRARSGRGIILGISFPNRGLSWAARCERRGLVSAMIDISDGLSTDLAHICEESGVGAEVEAEAVPRASVGKPAREVDLQVALHGGEDYELLFTAPAANAFPRGLQAYPFTRIGNIVRRRKILLMRRAALDASSGQRGGNISRVAVTSVTTHVYTHRRRSSIQ